jgi:hypothetical protein
MSRLFLPASALLAIVAGLFVFGLSGPSTVHGDVGGVYSDVPVFTPGQVVTITVTAEDDDGMLTIESNLDGSHLTVTNCTGIGSDQRAGECDGSGTDSVFNQGSQTINIDTVTLDNDRNSELLTLTLTLLANCHEPTHVTISGDQPGNFGPDDVTINCQPATPTPTSSPSPSPTPTKTATPTPTSTASPHPSATPTYTPQPPAAPTQTPFSQIETLIKPPNTGDAGLR